MAVPTVRPMSLQAVAGAVHVPHCLGEGDSRCPATGRVDPWLPQLAASLAIDVRTLVEFSGLMRREGFKVELSRFFLDLVYGYRQLAIAHSLGVPRLRTLALELFEACQRLDQRRRELSERSQLH
jgi:hypothetical protein